MATYKVHIKKNGYKTTYSTNDTTLATTIYRPDLDKYDLCSPSVGQLVNTREEADSAARESITAFFATVGLVPDFVND